MQLPSFDEIKKIHQQFAPTQAAYDSVFTHCQIVCEIAEQLAKNANDIDLNLLKVGCLLHDVGVYELYNAKNELDYANYIRHGILGEQLLKKLGFDERICRFAANHTGVGISKAEITASNLPMPTKDYFAKTKEERLTMYADKFHSKTDPPHFNAFETYEKFTSKFGQQNVDKFLKLADEFGKPSLEPLANKYRSKIV